MAINFKGSQSFVLRDGWAQKVFIEMENNPGVNIFSKRQGVVHLGVGSNMVISIKYWLETSGILESGQRNGPVLTPFGTALSKYDPYLEEPLTWCLLHANIVRNREMAPLFHVLFNELEVNEAFTKASFVETAASYLQNQGVETKKLDYLDDDFSVLIRTYLPSVKLDPEDNADSPLSSLSLVKQVAKGQYRKTMTNLENLDPRVVYYLLKETVGEETSKPFDDLVALENGPCRIFNIDRGTFMTILLNLHSLGFVKVVRAAGLNTIYFEEKDYKLSDLYADVGGERQ